MADGLFGLQGLERGDELLLGTCFPPFPPLSPVPNKPYVASVDVEHHEKKSCHLKSATELRSCVKVEVAVLGSRP